MQRHFVQLALAASLLVVSVSISLAYTIPHSVMCNGGAVATGSSRQLIGTGGQAAIGVTGFDSWKVKAGFAYLVQRFGIVGVEVVGPIVPKVYTLGQNYPNPFNPTTTIPFGLPEASDVTLRLFDVSGRRVVTLIDDALPSGEYRIAFQTERLASGVYFYSLRAGAFHRVRRLTLIR